MRIKIFYIVLVFCFLLGVGCFYENKNPQTLNNYKKQGYEFEQISFKEFESKYQEKIALYETFYSILQKIKDNPKNVDKYLKRWKLQLELLKKSPNEFPKKIDWINFKKLASQTNAKVYFYNFETGNLKEGKYSEKGICIIEKGTIIFKHKLSSGNMIYITNPNQ